MMRPATTSPAVRPAPTPAVRPSPSLAVAEGGLLWPLLGRRVSIRLVFGDTVEGVLSRIDKFELAVTPTDGSTCIVFKGAISSVVEAPQGAAGVR
jgi:sRNA-binding regulator protein Hfq